MNDELSISVSEGRVEDERAELSGFSVGRPCDVSKLALPFDGPREFADEEFRKGYCSNHLLGFLPLQLRALRKSEGLSQKDLAAKLNTQQSAISRLEDVENGGLNIGTAIQIGEALDRPFIAYWGHYSEVLEQVARSSDAPQAYLLTAPYRHDRGFRPWKPPLPCSENEQIRSVQKRLFEWLDTEPPDAGRLMRFLAGYDLAVVSQALPPYQWLVQAIREWGLAGKARENLLGAVAECLDRLATAFGATPDLNWTEWEPLFHFCEMMPEPDRLGGALYRLDELFRQAAREQDRILPYDTRYAFSGALLKNQFDGRLFSRLTGLKNRELDAVILSTPREIEEAHRIATLKAMRNPASFVRQAAMLIYSIQWNYRDKTQFQHETRGVIERVLLPNARTEDLPVEGSALIFWGVIECRWVDRTAKWTREVLESFAAGTEHIIGAVRPLSMEQNALELAA